MNKIFSESEGLELEKLISIHIGKLQEIKKNCKTISKEEYNSYRDMVLTTLNNENGLLISLVKGIFDWIEDEMIM